MSEHIDYEAARQTYVDLIIPDDYVVPDKWIDEMGKQSHAIVDAALPDGDLYQRCPDCDGRGSISIMDGQGRETEHQCECCYHSGGYVKVERGNP